MDCPRHRRLIYLVLDTMATRIRVTISPYLLTVEDRLLSYIYIYINSCLQHAFEPRY
ncbi:hypothetical protein PLUA15_290092 [Pseudomonas lundensis]|uniref:Uncharacterized protein n=1 Tax=Pseudomonas lundensis TaxID=86185 RepID=A0AAX2HAA1_9PSED|nr:hypothetical protein PLUA15_290092 [Pseudomonas lundensis]